MSVYPSQSECPGECRLPGSYQWFVKEGENAQQATYCKVCVEAGCADIEKDKGSTVILTYANCDCPDPNKHYSAEQLRFPTKYHNKAYADYVTTKEELAGIKRQYEHDLERLEHKLANFYSQELINTFQSPTICFDPEPTALAQRSSNIYVIRTHDCGCVEWADGIAESGRVGTWHCRWHLWKWFSFNV